MIINAVMMFFGENIFKFGQKRNRDQTMTSKTKK